MRPRHTDVLNLIQNGINTADDIALALKIRRKTVLIYLRELEDLGIIVYNQEKGGYEIAQPKDPVEQLKVKVAMLESTVHDLQKSVSMLKLQNIRLQEQIYQLSNNFSVSKYRKTKNFTGE